MLLGKEFTLAELMDSVADPGEGPGGPAPPPPPTLFLDQTESQRAEKKFYETGPHRYLGLDPPEGLNNLFHINFQEGIITAPTKQI